MSDAPPDPIDRHIDRLLDPVVRCFTPAVAERLLDVDLDPEVRRRLDELAAKANEGELTDEEHAEYERCVDVIDFIALLQAKASLLLK